MKRSFLALLAVTLAFLAGGTARANDEQIAKQIIQRLQQQKSVAQLDGFNIGVQVEDGTVTMKGSVAQSDHALMALDVARRVPGVKLVVNDLFVNQGVTAAPGTMPQVAQVADTSPVQMKSPFVSAQPVQPAMQVAQMPQIGGTTAGFVSNQPATPVGLGAAPAAAQTPLAFASSPTLQGQRISYDAAPEYPQAAPAQYASGGAPMPMPMNNMGGGAVAQATYDNPQMPGYAWPSYAAYPNYAALTYPHQYSPTAWPYIGPFYPYPQVPLGWRKVTLEWDDGWWFLDFKSK
ncbi:MAG: BON domain-containing protein [Planctomycetales bacterium]|nr:BON domain-containing protein [Planctomycetales bacterium]